MLVAGAEATLVCGAVDAVADTDVVNDDEIVGDVVAGAALRASEQPTETSAKTVKPRHAERTSTTARCLRRREAARAE